MSVKWRGQEFNTVEQAKEYWKNATDADLKYIMDTNHKQRVDWIRQATKIVEPYSSVLDVGCGTGIMVETLPEGTLYHGIDLNKEYVEMACKKYPTYFFEVEDFYNLIDTPTKFDYIIITSLFGLFPEEETYRLISKFWNMSMKGMAITTLNKERYRNAPGRQKIKNALTSHDPKELEEYLKSLPGASKIEVVSNIDDGSRKPMKMAAYVWRK